MLHVLCEVHVACEFETAPGSSFDSRMAAAISVCTNYGCTKVEGTSRGTKLRYKLRYELSYKSGMFGFDHTQAGAMLILRECKIMYA